MFNRILNNFKAKRELEKRLAIKKQKEKQELSAFYDDLDKRKQEIAQKNKESMINSILNNPVFLKASTRGLDLPPAVAVQNLVENLRQHKMLDEFYQPIIGSKE